MSLKLKDFARTDIKSEKVSTQEEKEESDDDISYLPPASGKYSGLSGHSDLNFDDVPRNIKDEKPYFGPRDTDGNIQVQYPSMIDGYSADGNQLARMESLGLPTGFSLRMDGTEKQKKGEKKTFYCQICLIELNSLDTMKSHVKGVKHMKKELALNAQKEEKIRSGEMSRHEADRRPRVIPIPNPESTKKKVPVRLHEKIKETRDPVVGLDFIREYIAVSDPEMEPHYECELCGNQGIANGMFSHLMGHRHRQRFVEAIYKDDPSRVMDLSQGELLKYARTHNENGDDLGKRIRTRRSDEEYPWPPGKAPWALERGGTGTPPDGARENWGKNKHYGQGSEEDIKPVVVGRVFADGKHRGGGLPSLESLKAPKTEEDAIKMIQLGEKMLSLGFEFSGSRLNHNEKSVLGTCLTTIVSKILEKRGMKANGHHSPPRERRQTENNGVQKRSRDRNSRSPSPHPVKRERISPSSGEGTRGGSRNNRERETNRENYRNGRETYSNGHDRRGSNGYEEHKYSGQHDRAGSSGVSSRNGNSHGRERDESYDRHHSREKY
eukprot:GFUD01016910.1.p1 GENE.GFUD01016910.1~~GFUD01016910.1.p1  ORF type:complete len:552 (+),score=129.19 GFUD01016910.1:89-1744(+)